MIAVVLNTYDAYGWAAQVLDQGFATPPNAKGTGERLPAVKVSAYAQRLADRTSFLALTRGGAKGTTPVAAITSTSTTPAERAAVAGTTAVPTTGAAARDGHSGKTAAAAAPARSGTGAGSGARGGGSSWFSVRNVVIVAMLLLVAFVVLRRRAVRRRRQRRLAQRRAVAAAMRRGSLPVVDGRYRTGMRVGPPLDTHVRVHPVGRPPGKAG
jgi:hypothetical protein